MIEPDHVYGRFVALIASVFVSLVAGTPYLYGVYSPQLVQRAGLSTSDAAAISLAVNIGSGLGGLPAGLFIDQFGPRKLILLGSGCIFTGYFALNRIFLHQISSLFLICSAMVFVGFGSVTSFFAGLKAAQTNFPHHRGSAGALPVGAYGLAATLFSVVAAKLFPDDTEHLLLFLAIFCGSIAFCGAWFIKIFADLDSDDEEEAPIPGAEISQQKRRFSLRGSFSFWGLGSRTPLMNSLNGENVPIADNSRPLPSVGGSGTSTPKSNSTTVFLPTEMETSDLLLLFSKPKRKQTPMEVITMLITDKLFIVHYIITALCSGTGQTYIYTVGFIVSAQFSSHEPPKNSSAATIQAVQVSIISLSSFGGRVIAGFLSDFIHRKLNAQRQWVVLATIALLAIGQLALIRMEGLEFIKFTSILIGGGYGLLNGTYPAIIADTFGVKNFSTAWGIVCSGLLIVLFSLEKIFGLIYDEHTNESGRCVIGAACYREAFYASFSLCVVAMGITATLIFVRRK